MPHDVFISYSQKDKNTAQAVCHALEMRGIRCWMAPRDIDPGKEWMPAIAEALTASRALVLVFSSRANGSRHVAREVSIAFDEEVPIIPFRIEEVPPSTALKFAIGTTHWLDALTPPLEQHLETLARKVQSLLGSESSAGRGTRGEPAPAQSPKPAATLWLPGIRRPAPRWAAAAAALALLSVLLVLALRAPRRVDPTPLPDPAPGATAGVTDAAAGSAPDPATGNLWASPADGDAAPATAPGPEPETRRAADRPPNDGPAAPEPTGPRADDPPPQTSEVADRPPAGAPSAGMDIPTATTLLDRAVAAKDLSMQGQVRALEALLAAGFEYTGADLSGIRLSGANLARGVFTRAVLAGADLSNGTVAAADLRGTDFRFANLKATDLASARLEAALAGFADAEAAVFRDAVAPRAEFYGAHLHSADFRNADLRGASFVMADLRGARLDGANLENALFYATLLEGATFDGAVFRNTEITASALSPNALTAQQRRGTCTSHASGPTAHARMDIRLIERIPNAQFSGGIEYSMLTRQGMFGLRSFPVAGLAPCSPRSGDNPGIWVADGVSQVSLDWGAAYDTELVSRAGRRRGWVSRIETHMTRMMDTLNARHGH